MTTRSGWYTPTTARAYLNVRRDETIDFLRGIAIVLMTIVHIEYFSVLTLIAWERLGFVTAAEWFVALAGLVLGGVCRARIAKVGLTTTIWKAVSRGLMLYGINIALIILVILLLPFPFINMISVTNFIDHGTGVVYPLYPIHGSRTEDWFNTILLLRGGPHQIQVLGLYIVLLIFFVPWLILALQFKNGVFFALFCSASLYAWYFFFPFHWSKMQFENAFPVACWQLLFTGGFLLGWFAHEIRLILAVGHRRRSLYIICATVTLVLLVLAQGHLDPFTPSWAKFSLLPAKTIDAIYVSYARKNTLGPLRLLNDLCLLITLYGLIHRYWNRIGPTLGRIFVPIGQASLYCFIVHFFLVFIESQILTFELKPPYWVMGTALHIAAIALLWLFACYGPGLQFFK